MQTDKAVREVDQLGIDVLLVLNPPAHRGKNGHQLQ